MFLMYQMYFELVALKLHLSNKLVEDEMHYKNNWHWKSQLLTCDVPGKFQCVNMHQALHHHLLLSFMPVSIHKCCSISVLPWHV